jgi:hypothetical protein
VPDLGITNKINAPSKSMATAPTAAMGATRRAGGIMDTDDRDVTVSRAEGISGG